MSEKQAPAAFTGFEAPAANYSKLPHKFIECLPMIDSMAELKVVLYLLRHTWGFSEYDKPKKITTDEFMKGRKKRDGSRIDNGTGLSNKSVIAGLENAIEHGFILVDVDETDKARIEKSYRLSMSDVGNLHSGVENLHSGYEEPTQRSEKETDEKKPIKESKYRPRNAQQAIEAGVPVTEEIIRGDELAERQKVACDAFERAFGIDRPWNWYPPKEGKLWAELRDKLTSLYEEDNDCFTGYARWANEKFSRGAKSAGQIKHDPTCFWDAWAAYKASEMYAKKTDETKGEYRTRKIERLDR